MEHINYKIKREEIEETLSEFKFAVGDLEILKNEELVRQMCTDELNIKDELEENQDETNQEACNYSEKEIYNRDYHLADNCENDNAEGMKVADVTIIKEENSSRQCLDSFEETLTNEKYFKGFPSVSTHIDKNYLTAISTKTLFKCILCNYQCAHKSYLVKHMRIHTGEKPFECSVCNNKFAIKSCLVTHMRIHTGEKPYECSVCDYKFAQKKTLVNHMRVHTGEKPFKCGVCEYKFARKHNLVNHMFIHTGEKPCECSVCGKKFALKSNLVVHMRIHTGEKPFRCIHCDYNCSQKNHLVKHMQYHTQ